MKLTLSDAHVYTDETGKVWPNVTSILKDAGIVDTRFFDTYSRDRGKAVHLATALYDRGDLDEDSVDPIVRPYLDAWIRFRAESGFVPEMIERIVWNENFLYAGTLDRTGTITGRQVLLDIKSGAAQPYTALQTVAYAECLDGNYQRYAIELHDNGKYKPVAYNDRQDRQVWYAYLMTRNWEFNNNIK